MTKRKGPLPTASRICWKGSVAASRAGMMKACGLAGMASVSISSGKRAFSRKRKRKSSSAASSSVRAASAWPIGLRRIQRFSDATASAAVTLSPSWKRRPGRSVMVQVRPSSSKTWPAAICGCATKSASTPYSVSQTM